MLILLVMWMIISVIILDVYIIIIVFIPELFEHVLFKKIELMKGWANNICKKIQMFSYFLKNRVYNHFSEKVLVM